MSPSKKYLAICEKGDVKAFCTIIDINSGKKKVLPEHDEVLEFKTREFLSAAFSPKNEKQHIMTLCGDPDWSLLLWQWDTFKVLFKLQLAKPDLTADAQLSKSHYQCSISNLSTEMIAVVTGPHMYAFIQVADGAFNHAVVKKDSLDTSTCDI